MRKFSPFSPPFVQSLSFSSENETQKQEALGTARTKSQSGGTCEEWSVLREQGVQMPQREQDENNHHHQMLKNLASCRLWSWTHPLCPPPSPSTCIQRRQQLVIPDPTQLAKLRPLVRLSAQSKPIHHRLSPPSAPLYRWLRWRHGVILPQRSKLMSSECSSVACREEPARGTAWVEDRVLKQNACWNLQSCSLARRMRDIFNSGFICLSFSKRIKLFLGCRKSKKKKTL